MKPIGVTPAAQDGGGGTVSDRLPKPRRTSFDDDDADAEGDQELILRRAAVEVADDHQLDEAADHHQEQRAGDHRDDEGPGRLERHVAGIAAQHEHRAVRQVQHAERAVDDGQARADQRQQRARCQSVE